MSNILLTGSPGVGKSTLIKRVVDQLKSSDVAGFFTEEIREGSVRKGFKIETLDGQTGVLAHVDANGPYRVGKYRVNLEDFERIGVTALAQGLLGKKRIIAIDEIGKMELFSHNFRAGVLQALDSDITVLATVGKIAHPLVDEIKKRRDVKLVEVTTSNRDSLVDEIAKALRHKKSVRIQEF